MNKQSAYRLSVAFFYMLTLLSQAILAQQSSVSGNLSESESTVFQAPDTAGTLQTGQQRDSISAGDSAGATPGGHPSPAERVPGQAAAPQTQTQARENFGDEKKLIDILLDISQGFTMTRFIVKEPDYISTRGKYDFTYAIGIMLPFKQRFYAEVGFRYMRLKFSLSSTLWSSVTNQTVSTDTKYELMNFVSLPVQLGMRFEIRRFIPFFYIDCVPAYLTAGSQYVVVKSETIFSDGSKMKSTYTQDIETTKNRARFQTALGGGIGLEWLYGYGSIYLDGSCQFVLGDPDAKNDTVSLPQRTASRLIYFPVSLGLRFFL
jgi:hypothetical protein